MHACSYPIRLHLEWNPSNSSTHILPHVQCLVYMVWWNVLPPATILHVKPNMHGRTYALEVPTANTGCMMSYSSCRRYIRTFVGFSLHVSVLHNVARELELPKTAPILCAWVHQVLATERSEWSFSSSECTQLFVNSPPLSLFVCKSSFVVVCLPFFSCRCLFAVLPCRYLFTAHTHTHTHTHARTAHTHTCSRTLMQTHTHAHAHTHTHTCARTHAHRHTTHTHTHTDTHTHLYVPQPELATWPPFRGWASRK